jgi:hypothetical protein
LNYRAYSLKSGQPYRDWTGWLGREDSNLRMAESKSAALPLGYAPNWIAAGRSRAAGRNITAPPPRINDDATIDVAHTAYNAPCNNVIAPAAAVSKARRKRNYARFRRGNR